MRLSELLSFNDIVIQCHDNPDADALASGTALVWYFAQKGKKARFIYRGNNQLQKSNLIIMLSELSKIRNFSSQSTVSTDRGMSRRPGRKTLPSSIITSLRSHFPSWQK